MGEEKTIFDKVHEAYQREDAKGHFIKDEKSVVEKAGDSLGGMSGDARDAMKEHNKANDDAADNSDGTN